MAEALSSVNQLLHVLREKLTWADGLYHNGHEGVVGAAQLRALSIEDALAIDVEPHLVQAPWHGIDLDAQ